MKELKYPKLWAAAGAVFLLVGLCLFFNSKEQTPKLSQEEISKRNLAKLHAMENEIFACIAYVEDFYPNVYFCGAKYTIGYGTTIYPKGTKVKKSNKAISKTYAKTCVLAHMEKRVYPFICKYVTVELDSSRLLSTCLFVYNVGGELFSGYTEKGKKRKKESSFLTTLNNEESNYECAIKMTGFRNVGGNLSRGLLKRHWVQMAIMCEVLSVEQVLQLKPAHFYESKDLLALYESRKPAEDGFYKPKFDEETVNAFIKLNTKKKTTLSILDKETQEYFNNKKGSQV